MHCEFQDVTMHFKWDLMSYQAQKVIKEILQLILKLFTFSTLMMANYNRNNTYRFLNIKKQMCNSYSPL